MHDYKFLEDLQWRENYHTIKFNKLFFSSNLEIKLNWKIHLLLMDCFMQYLIFNSPTLVFERIFLILYTWWTWRVNQISLACLMWFVVVSYLVFENESSLLHSWICNQWQQAGIITWSSNASSQQDKIKSACMHAIMKIFIVVLRTYEVWSRCKDGTLQSTRHSSLTFIYLYSHKMTWDVPWGSKLIATSWCMSCICIEVSELSLQLWCNIDCCVQRQSDPEALIADKCFTTEDVSLTFYVYMQDKSI